MGYASAILLLSNVYGSVTFWSFHAVLLLNINFAQ